MLIDSHCHLDWKSFTKDIDDVIKRAKENGLIAIVTSTFHEGFEKTLRYAEKYEKYVFMTLGLHPPQVNINSVKKTINLIRKNKNKIKAIGEVGLDYYWVKDPKKRQDQKEGFVKFIDLSQELELPLVIHARNAHKDAIDILEKQSAEDVLMHCFSGKTIDIKRVIKNKWLVSIPTSVTNRGVHQNVARLCPLKNILLETDSPFLSPFKKSRNEPMNVKFAAEKVAEIKNINIEEVAKITTKNSIKFYNLEV
ncbi:MAG: TatD family hydrolase [Candidatus Helarchaeota archaeon]